MACCAIHDAHHSDDCAGHIVRQTFVGRRKAVRATVAKQGISETNLKASSFVMDYSFCDFRARKLILDLVRFLDGILDVHEPSPGIGR